MIALSVIFKKNLRETAAIIRGECCVVRIACCGQLLGLSMSFRPEVCQRQAGAEKSIGILIFPSEFWLLLLSLRRSLPYRGERLRQSSYLDTFQENVGRLCGRKLRPH